VSARTIVLAFGRWMMAFNALAFSVVRTRTTAWSGGAVRSGGQFRAMRLLAQAAGNIAASRMPILSPQSFATAEPGASPRSWSSRPRWNALLLSISVA
jgi:hypothetical protein